MGKITNPIEVFRMSTLSSSSWMALEPTLFKQVEANQPSMFCVASESYHHLVDGLVTMLMNMFKDPRSKPFCVRGQPGGHPETVDIVVDIQSGLTSSRVVANSTSWRTRTALPTPAG